eukprot:Hpha_TRINITY_DN15606_c1_g3::TRINITY_DN15606_c1_g3_i1::g.100703::m.100703
MDIAVRDVFYVSCAQSFFKPENGETMAALFPPTSPSERAGSPSGLSWSCKERSGYVGIEIERTGTTIKNLVKGGAADRQGGLKIGDKILYVIPNLYYPKDRVTINSARDFGVAVSPAHGVFAGTTVRIGYERGETRGSPARRQIVDVVADEENEASRASHERHLTHLRNVVPEFANLDIGLALALTLEPGRLYRFLWETFKRSDTRGDLTVDSADCEVFLCDFCSDKLRAPALLPRSAVEGAFGAEGTRVGFNEFYPGARLLFFQALANAERNARRTKELDTGCPTRLQ